MCFEYYSYSHLFTAQVGRAPGVRTQDGVRVVYGGVLVRALVKRAERLAALLFLALVAFTLNVFGVLVQRETVRAFSRSHSTAYLFCRFCHLLRETDPTLVGDDEFTVSTP